MRKFLYLFLVIGLVGCGELTGISSDVRGTYTLYSVNGYRLPVVWTDDGYTETVIHDGTLQVESNGDFTESLWIEEVGVTDVYRRNYYGTYSGSRSDLTFRYDEGGIADAEYVNGEIRLYGPQDTFVYRRN